MHPNGERASHGYWEADDPPDPNVAHTGAEFVAELRELLRWSGLSLSEIEHRAREYGHYLPDGAISDALSHNTLPGEDLLLTMLWAVGCDDETVELWVWVRGRLEAESAHFDPAEVSWVPDEQPKKYSEGSLAHAVKERRNQNGWRGLHRGNPDDADTKHTSKRVRAKESQPKESRSHGGRSQENWSNESRSHGSRSQENRSHGSRSSGVRSSGARSVAGWSSNWSSRVMIGAVVAGGLAFVVGIAVALTDSDEPAAAPRGQNNKACCSDSSAPQSPTPDVPQASIMPIGGPTPSLTGKSPAPRPTQTTQGPRSSPTPTQTQTQQTPKVTGSGRSTGCASQNGKWVVTVSLTATLTGAASGTDPQGRAGQGSPSQNVPMSGSGTSFSGSAPIDVGSDATPSSGTIQWSVTVSVAGSGSVSDSGNASFNCP